MLVIVIIVIAVIIKGSKSKADAPQQPDTIVYSAFADHRTSENILGGKAFRITL
ncbi:hypothetical protein ACWELJ_33985 [Nocardia sp. NPDC004582]